MSTGKATLATVKSFAKKNANNLYIKNLASFDGMEDGVRALPNCGFRKADALNLTDSYSWGIGAWFVGRSRDYFNAYDKDGFVGFEVTNSCGNFVLAVLA